MLLGTHVLLFKKTITLYAVFDALWFGFIGALITGFIGYQIGRVIESPPHRKAPSKEDVINTDDDLLIDDIMIDEIKNIQNSE